VADVWQGFPDKVKSLQVSDFSFPRQIVHNVVYCSVQAANDRLAVEKADLEREKQARTTISQFIFPYLHFLGKVHGRNFKAGVRRGGTWCIFAASRTDERHFAAGAPYFQPSHVW
jgi:hypothetical protein